MAKIEQRGPKRRILEFNLDYRRENALQKSQRMIEIWYDEMKLPFEFNLRNS